MYRIMFFPGHISGGVGVVVMNIFRNINKEKFEIDFCVPESDKGEYDEEIENSGSHVYRIPQIKAVGPFRFIRTVKEILVKNGPYDAVHVHSVHMGALAIIAAKRAGISKRIYHVHNTQDAALDHLPLHSLIEKGLKSRILKNSTVYLACGQEAGKYIYGKHSFTVINNAVDTKRFYPYEEERRQAIKEKLSIGTKSKYIIGNIARFSKVKNQKRLVDIAFLDKKSRNLLAFLMVGDGETIDEIKEYAKEKGCDENIVFVGQRVDTEDMYNSMDVFCLPSFFEGLPVTMIEAQACGLPCLVSDAVTKESDLGISKVVYLSLSESDQRWLDSLYELIYKRVTDRKIIGDVLVKEQYELLAMISQIEDIYLK